MVEYVLGQDVAELAGVLMQLAQLGGKRRRALGRMCQRLRFVDQRAPARHLDAMLEAHGGAFGDAVLLCIAASGFQVNNNKTGQHAVGCFQQKISASQAGSSMKLSAA